MTVREFAATRHAPGSGAPPTPHDRADYRVFVVCPPNAVVGVRSRDRDEETRILLDSTIDHTSRMFGMMAGGGRTRTINVFWATEYEELFTRTDRGQLTPIPRPQELVIHLVAQFESGLLGRWLRDMDRPGSGWEGRFQIYRERAQPRRMGSVHAGLTLVTSAGTVSEVYPAAAYSTIPEARNLDNTNWRAAVQGGGQLIAATMFHESMHNKLDPRHASSWDMHEPRNGGGGLALATIEPVDPNRENIDLLRPRLTDARPAQALPLNRRIPVEHR
jgi:hypothetical protein